MDNIFVVECWSDRTYPDPAGENSHFTNVCHIASTQEKAVEWCKQHSSYGSPPNTDGYYPWHFRVFRLLVDEDGCCVVGNTHECVYDSSDVEEEEDFQGHYDEAGLKEYHRGLDFLDKLPALLRDVADVVEEHLK